MSDDLRPPQPPTPTRLNRRVLLVAAVTLVVTLLATAYTLTHSGSAGRPAASPAPVPAPGRPAEPRFLERPPATAPAIDEERLRELLASQATSGLPPSGTFPAEDPAGYPAADPDGSQLDALGGAAAVPAPPAPVLPDRRRTALERALVSPLQPSSVPPPRSLPVQGGPGAMGLAGGSGPAPGLPAIPDPATFRDLFEPAPAPPAGPADPHERFLAGAARAARADHREIALALDRPTSPFRLQAGTVLPAALVTAVRSDLPGSVVAQLTQDVYDPTQTYLLLPRGARLLGRYDSQVSAGQDRLLVAWDRILLPDGSSLRLPGLAGASPGGSAGLAGAVDSHYGRLFGNALLLSLISAGVQLSQPQESATAGQAPSSRQVAAGALGQQLGTLALELTRRNLDLRPTIRLPAGLPFHVHLTADLVLPGPYRP